MLVFIGCLFFFSVIPTTDSLKALNGNNNYKIEDKSDKQSNIGYSIYLIFNNCFIYGLWFKWHSSALRFTALVVTKFICLLKLEAVVSDLDWHINMSLSLTFVIFTRLLLLVEVGWCIIELFTLN